jgi:SAM-dependent methyltransferase
MAQRTTAQHPAGAKPPGRHPALSWPLPALLAWAASWVLFLGLHGLRVPPGWAVALAAALGVAAGLPWRSPWRRLIVAAGFPLSLAASGLGAGLAAWPWLAALGLFALLYPASAWRDAPLFPTPKGNLEGLAAMASLPAGACILDAGCGLGAGLAELRRVFPAARLTGLEWSWPLRLLCGLRCPFARVRRGDIWKADWSGYDMVYMFQRPESMGPAADKARRELRPGALLVSLEFEAPSLRPAAVLRNPGRRPVWVYRMK